MGVPVVFAKEKLGIHCREIFLEQEGSGCSSLAWLISSSTKIGLQVTWVIQKPELLFYLSLDGWNFQTDNTKSIPVFGTQKLEVQETEFVHLCENSGTEFSHFWAHHFALSVVGRGTVIRSWICIFDDLQYSVNIGHGRELNLGSCALSQVSFPSCCHLCEHFFNSSW